MHPHMPIDYSQPGYQEMFANYGLTAIAALSLEKTLLLLVVAIDNLGNGNLPKEKIYEYLEKSGSGKPLNKKTMGNLIDEVNQRITISSSLEKDLKKSNDWRNYVIHHFFMDEYETLASPSGPVALSHKLRPIRDTFLRLQWEVDAILEKVCAELRKARTELSQEMRKLLKGDRAI